MRFLLAIAPLALLAGCNSIALFQRPQSVGIDTFELPEVWASAASGNQGKISTGWVKGFRDSRMSALIEEALKNNHDFKAASARLRNARQGSIIGRSARWPTIGIGGSSSRSRRNETPAPAPAPAPVTTTTTTLIAPAGGGAPASTTVTSTSVPGSAPAPAPMSSVVYSGDYGLSLDAAWEMDLWGRLRDLDHASYADYVAAQADFRSARLSLAANTAKAYFDLIAAQQQLELAEKTRESFQRNYRITERNYKAGDDTASPLDVQFGRNNVASAERDLINRRLARDESARPLEVLLGRYPKAEIRGSSTLPKLKTSVPAGLPSELLARRPDIVAAEAAVYASAKRADAARKNMLPSFRLTAGGATSSEELGKMLVDPELIVWNAATSLSQSVLEGGRLNAEAQRALSQNEEAIQNYASVVLRALREVESALATERSLGQQEDFLDTELRQANLAERQAARDYSEGIVGILEVLEAQRRAVSARISMINLRNQRLQNRIDLHLALGGDFKTSP